jgi:hypothetical protein
MSNLNETKLNGAEWCEFCCKFGSCAIKEIHTVTLKNIDPLIIKSFIINYFDTANLSGAYMNYNWSFVNYVVHNLRISLKEKYTDVEDAKFSNTFKNAIHDLIDQKKLKLISIAGKDNHTIEQNPQWEQIIKSFVLCKYDIPPCMQANETLVKRHNNLKPISWCKLCDNFYHKADACFMNRRRIEEFLVNYFEDMHDCKSFFTLIKEYINYIKDEFSIVMVIDNLHINHVFCYIFGNVLNLLVELKKLKLVPYEEAEKFKHLALSNFLFCQYNKPVLHKYY